MLREKPSEVGIPKRDQEANLHLLQSLTFEYGVDKTNPAVRPEPDSQPDRGPDAYNVPGVRSEQEAGGR